MILRNTNSLVSEFRESRGQSQEPPKKSEPPKKKKNSGGSYYDSFLRKYDNLENTIDSLGTRGLVYYFREIAGEQGYKYVISNIKKDMSIMKRLRNNFSNREICGMIEFLYLSEQDYLDKSRLSINILGSNWINTIYADMKLWVEDKYIPRGVQEKRKKSVKDREWNKDVSNTEDVSIGVKL